MTESPIVHQKYFVFWFSILLLITIFSIYCQVKNFGFILLDDPVYITDNTYVKEGITIKGIAWAFTTFHFSYWHPLTWISHMVDCELYGLNPSGHHWTNLMIHIANSLLLFFILYHMTGKYWRSFIVAILFAIHPLHVESVVWISERKDVLSTFFFMITIGSYYHYANNRSFSRYLLVVIALSLGLMAKPMLVTTPFILLLLDIWPLNRILFTGFAEYESDCKTPLFNYKVFFILIWEKVPLFILIAIISAITVIAQKSIGAMMTLGSVSLKERISNAIISYIKYFVKTFIPINLSIYYPHPNVTIPIWVAIIFFIFLALLFFIAIKKLDRYPYIFVGLSWFLGTLIPVIGLVQVGNQAMADRYTYIPLIGFFIVIVWSASDLFDKYAKNKKIVYPFIISSLLALTYLSHKQVNYWKSDTSLFKHAIEVTEKNWFAHNLLGVALYKNDKIEEAIFHFKESIKICPILSSSHSNLAVALTKTRDFKNAIKHYQKAIKIDATDAGIFFNMGTTLFIMGKYDEAANAFENSLAIDPESADSHLSIAKLRHIQRNYNKAKYHYKQAININPKLIDAHYHYGLLLKRLGDYRESFLQFAKVIEIDSNNANAYFQIGDLLFYKGKMKASRLFFKKAVEINPDYKEARNRLKEMDK